MKKFGFISDIHAYRIPLQFALEDIVTHLDNNWIADLGDITPGGGQEKEVVRLLNKYGVISIEGNHEKEAQRYSGNAPEVDKFLRNLKKYIEFEKDGKKYILTHSNPLSVVAPFDAHIGRDPWRDDSAIKIEEQARSVFERVDYDYMFVGHCHAPLTWELTKEGKVVKFYDQDSPINPDSRYIINPGAVGDPHMTPHLVNYYRPKPNFTSRWLVFDTEDHMIRRFRKEMYKDGQLLFDVPESERGIYLSPEQRKNMVPK